MEVHYCKAILMNLVEKGLSGFRENLDEEGKLIEDLNNIKFDYLTKGGKDPGFLLNLEKIENVYKNELGKKSPRKGNTSESSIFDTSFRSPTMAKDKAKAFQNKLYENWGDNSALEPKRDLKYLSETATSHIQAGNKTLRALQQKMTSTVEFGMKDPMLKPPKGLVLEGESEEEKLLMEYKRQEEEAMEAISLISPYSDLYKYKMAQIKRLHQLKSELEKIVQEQRYQRMWEQSQNNKAVIPAIISN
jgi:hypothetical protein